MSSLLAASAKKQALEKSSMKAMDLWEIMMEQHSTSFL